MSWNHRVVRRTVNYKNIEHVYYSIHEVYYDPDGSIYGWVAEPAQPYGETLEELEDDLKLIQSAVNLPVIDEEDLPGGLDG